LEKKDAKQLTKKKTQLHSYFFKPILVKELTAVEQKWVVESLIFVTKKKDRRLKAKTCANGSTQHEYFEHYKAASPTAMTESHLITAVFNTKQS
jgi:hypothetical protein